MANIQEVARRAGVSTATVSRYFAGQRVRNREAIVQAVEELGYSPSVVARSLKSGRHHSIGVVVPDIANPFFAGLVKGIELEARSRGSEIILGNSDEDASHERALLTSIAQRVDGIIIAPVLQEVSSLRRIGDIGIPLVLVDRDVEIDPTIDRVLVDNTAGAHLAVEHLAGLGHTRIGFIGGPLDSTPGRGRFDGFCAAVADYGLDDSADYVRISNFRENGGYDKTRELVALPNRPTAIFAANNLMTLGTLRALHELGLSVPGDISVIGFDDLSFAPLLDPPLTAIRRNEVMQGSTAGRLLLDRIAAGESATDLGDLAAGSTARRPDRVGERVVLPIELVVRSSTARPPAQTDSIPSSKGTQVSA